MMRRTVSLAALVTLATASPGLQALGLAEPEVTSSLSEPLQARMTLSDLQGLDPSHLIVKLADAEAFAQAGLPRSALAESVQVALSREAGRLSVTLSTDKPVNEPYLDLLLALEWPNGTMRRQVTLLLDPPGYASTAALIGNEQPRSAGTPRMAQASPLASASPIQGSESQAVAPVVQSRRIEVRPGDTLWGIAARLERPDGVSVEQAMMALFRANPAAFPGGNINNLRAGAMLEKPSAQQLLTDSSSEARHQVSQQNQAWRVQERDAPLPAPEAPRLTLLSDAELAAETLAASGDPASQRLADSAASGGVAAPGVDAPSLDAATRLAALEANWQASREALAEVRDERDRLQDEMLSLREDMAALRELLSQSLAAVPEGQATASVQPEPALATDAQASTPQVLPPQGQAGKTGLWQGVWQGIVDQAGLIGGSAIALLLLVWAVVRRRSQRAPEEALDYGFPQAISESGVPDFVEKVPATVPQAAAAPAEATPQAETINEADIFIAYGRYEQARDLLEKSLESEPERHDLRLKLLITYTELGMRDAAEGESARLLEHAEDSYRADVEHLMARFADDAGSSADEPQAVEPSRASAERDDDLAPALSDVAERLQDEASHVEEAVASVAADVERIIDYEPPSLESDHPPRRDELQQPSIDFPEFPDAGNGSSLLDDRGSSPSEVMSTEDQWDIEEVAFEPLNLDNVQPATDTARIEPER
ncbi:type IV pilus assembly protein FimV [Modicisalibacter xianhensis]|nr:FimV/HubP family polar landmark protein [Halomonas xianhensis]